MSRSVFLPKPAMRYVIFSPRNNDVPLLRTTNEDVALRFCGWGFPVCGKVEDQIIGWLDLTAMPSWRLQAAILPLL